MIAAETMGVPLSYIRLSSGDTDMGVDLGAYSSRQTLMTGHAVKEAAENVRQQVLEVLADELSIPMEEMDIKNGVIVFKNGPVDFSMLRARYIHEHRGWTDHPSSEDLTFKEASRIAYLAKGVIVGTGKYKPPFLPQPANAASMITAIRQ